MILMVTPKFQLNKIIREYVQMCSLVHNMTPSLRSQQLSLSQTDKICVF